MNKRKIFIFIGIIVLCLIGRALILRSLPGIDDYAVFIVCDDCHTQEEKNVRAAYESVLTEEGIPYRFVNAPRLLSMQPADAVKLAPAIIMPDTIAQTLPSDMEYWLEDYVRAGGHTAIVFDPGIRDVRGHFLNKPLFSDLAQVNYLQYKMLGSQTYGKGYFQFKDSASARLFEIPPGKAFEGTLLSGYAYGTLTYSMARTLLGPELNERDVYAYAMIDNKRYPALLCRSLGKGSVLYVNLPLGVLKGFSDDMPLRVILRSFLFHIVGIVHMVNAPRGEGGLVINWHIDANIDWKSIPDMINTGCLRNDMEYSLHITAGDFRDTPGDGLGFDAAGRGAPFVRMLSPYGVIGSHGGWAHNWFAEQLSSNTLSQQDIMRYIVMNNNALSKVTGKAVKEYSAPKGVHPQPDLTKIIERLGIIAYYYTGDCGSAPNRTFINGVMVSSTVIAFPILPFGKSASLHEMKAAGIPESEVEAWLLHFVDYIVDNHTIRLFYSHPYDMYDYPRALKKFVDYAHKRQLDQVLQVRSMSYFATFIQRFIRTSCRFERASGVITATISNPEGIADITLAIPRSRFIRPIHNGGEIREDKQYYYVTMISTNSSKQLTAASLQLVEGGS